MATVESLLTAEEYRLLPDNGQPNELVRGRIVLMNLPAPRHGNICIQIAYLLRKHLEKHDLGRVVGNDSAIVTEHDPDSVRGADVAFYSYARVPRGRFPQGYLAVVPELVFEVLSPDDRWPKVLAKIAEYLEAGVVAVCVVDPGPQTVQVYRADQPEQTFQAGDKLALPEVLPNFRVLVRRFFE